LIATLSGTEQALLSQHSQLNELGTVLWLLKVFPIASKLGQVPTVLLVSTGVPNTPPHKLLPGALLARKL